MTYKVYTDGVHLASPSLASLFAFASKIGLRRCWFHSRKRKSQHPHFDLTSRTKFLSAINAGAEYVSSKELIRLCFRGKDITSRDWLHLEIEEEAIRHILQLTCENCAHKATLMPYQRVNSAHFKTICEKCDHFFEVRIVWRQPTDVEIVFNMQEIN